MTTNIKLLPFVTFAALTTTTGEWADEIAFSLNGAPIDITGIAFRVEWRLASNPASSAVLLAASTDNGQVVNFGVLGKIALAVPLAVMSAIAPNSYVCDVYASADGHMFNLGEAGGSSSITHRLGI